MSAAEDDYSTWKKSSASNSGACVEVHRSGPSMRVRDSKDPAGPQLTFTAPEWAAFLVGARQGEFDWDEVPD